MAGACVGMIDAAGRLWFLPCASPAQVGQARWNQLLAALASLPNLRSLK